MVAGVVLGLAVIGVMSMLSVGRALESDDTLRRQALSLVSSELEKDKYQQFDPTVPDPGSKTITNATTIQTETAVPVPATLTVVVHNDIIRWKDGILPTTLIPVPFQEVKATLIWTFAGKADTVTLQKSIAAEK